MSLIGSKLRGQFRCLAQLLADYIVIHYLLYQAIYCESDFRSGLEGDDYDDVELYYRHLYIVSYFDKFLFVILWLLTACFYVMYVRKEITLFSF